MSFDSLDCEKKCKDCGELFSFKGNLSSLNKRKFCDKCRIAHRTRSDPVPFDEIIIERPIEPDLPITEPPKIVENIVVKEIRKPIGSRKCSGCETSIFIYSNRGKRKQYCKPCKTIRAKASNKRYLVNYVENTYARK